MYWIAIGDIHEHTSMLEKIPGIREAQGVIVSGDLTNRGSVAAAREVYEAIASLNTNIMAVIGNMDTESVASYLDKQGANLHLNSTNLFPGLDKPPVRAIGVGYSTPTPFNTPSEVPESQMAQWLDQAWKMTQPFEAVVAVIHTPPQGTKADDLDNGNHVGSTAVRTFLEKYKPVVCITGHIHEARSIDTLGPTTIINTGLLAHGGYAVISISNGQVCATLEQVG